MKRPTLSGATPTVPSEQNAMAIDIVIHRDRDGTGYWAETPQLPGCFAAGGTLAELRESLGEAVPLYLGDPVDPDLYVSDRIDSIERFALDENGRLTRLG